jgi:glucokinase
MYLGTEIGGTKFQVGVCDQRGRLCRLVREGVVRQDGAAGILRQFQRVIPPLLKQYPVRALGVGFGGPCDVRTGRAVLSHQIAGWENFPVRRWFAREFGLPVVVDNDQNCAAYAEAQLGAGKGKHCVFYVTVGTGIGGGLVLDGKLHNGRSGAAEIGHTKLFHEGRWRTVESLAAGLAIERRVSTVPQAARHLGVAIANVIAIVNPDVVIVGGGVATAGEKFWRPLRQTVKRLVFPVFRGNYQLVPPKLGQNVVVVGAALLAQESR